MQPGTLREVTDRKQLSTHCQGINSCCSGHFEASAITELSNIKPWKRKNPEKIILNVWCFSDARAFGQDTLRREQRGRYSSSSDLLISLQLILCRCDTCEEECAGFQSQQSSCFRSSLAQIAHQWNYRVPRWVKLISKPTHSSHLKLLKGRWNACKYPIKTHARARSPPASPVDFVSGAETLLVPLCSLRELRGLVEGPFIRQQPAQGSGGIVALCGGGRGSTCGGGHGGPAATAAEPEAESHPLP